MFKLVRFLKGYKLQLILGPIFKQIEALFELIVPLIMALIIDVGVKNRDAGYVLKMGGILILLGATGLISALTCQYFASVASQGTGTVLRNELFKHINTFSHAEIDKFGTAPLIVRLTNDVNQIQLAVAMLIRLAIRAPLLVIGAIIMTVNIDAELALIILAVTPFIAGVIYVIITRLTPFYKLIQRKLENIAVTTRETLSGARVVRAFSRQEREETRFKETVNDFADTSVRVSKLSALLNPVTSVIMNLGITAVIWFGGLRVYAGNLTQGKLIAFINYMTQILIAMLVAADLTLIFTKASASASRINELFEIKSSVYDSRDIKEIDFSNKTAVEFINVSFAYNKNSVLNGINLKINDGEKVGIIGGTGTGKSTLIYLIPRLYDVTRGNIKIYGTDVKEVPLEQLRKIVRLVPQQTKILTGTISDNLKWGDEKAGDNEILKALSIAQAARFVMEKPDGINALVTQDGKNLSGGQKQRLAIARALIGSPKILILDDSFSALDAATDYMLRQELKSECGGMTIITVSQRAGTIKYSDKIIVMENGEIAGTGTHDELYANCGVYREICESQSVGR